MKVKSYPVLVRAIEDGYKIGWNRAHKHVENPSKDMIEDAVIQAILSEICDWFDFDDLNQNDS